MNSIDTGDIATDKRIETPCGRVVQVAALVFRNGSSGVQVLLITSRGTGRWVLPKGWPQVGKTLSQSALAEAYEEAGVRGRVQPDVLGSYTYQKTDADQGEDDDFRVNVYAVEFTRSAKKWPERGERRLEWVSPEEAARRVDEPELRIILRTFGEDSARPASGSE